MAEKSKYCSEVMKKYFDKELVMTKKDNEDLENSSKCWICKYVDIVTKFLSYITTYKIMIPILLCKN